MKGMQSAIHSFLFLCFCNICIGQQNEPTGKQTQSLGKYWFVMYSKGVNGEQDSATKSKLMEDHINYIVNLRKIGKIVTGGAFLDKTPWMGFEIYNCKTMEEVIKITDGDPMVLSKIFSYEIHPWMTLKGEVKFE
jgi:uncharacterized protein YciI